MARTPQPTTCSPHHFAPSGCGELWLYNSARRTPAEVARVRDLVLCVVPVLRLADWTLHVKLTRLNGQGDCTANPEYRIATIRLNLGKIAPHWLPEMVAHELEHCHVEPLGALAMMWAGKDPERREIVRRAEEALTTVLGQRTVAMLNLGVAAD